MTKELRYYKPDPLDLAAIEILSRVMFEASYERDEKVLLTDMGSVKINKAQVRRILAMCERCQELEETYAAICWADTGELGGLVVSSDNEPYEVEV